MEEAELHIQNWIDQDANTQTTIYAKHKTTWYNQILKIIKCKITITSTPENQELNVKPPKNPTGNIPQETKPPKHKNTPPLPLHK